MKVVAKFPVFSFVTRKVCLFCVLLASAQLTTSCGWLHEKIGTPDPQLSPVAAGAVAGAAVGTGMGLAIGSSSGHAGEGVLIGSLAGAAAGGAIGNAVDRSKTAKKKGEVQGQGDVIEEQQLEIDKLKKNRDDVSSSKKSGATAKASSSSSSRAMLAKDYKDKGKANSYIREGYRGNPRAVPFSVTADSDKAESKGSAVDKKAAKLQAKGATVKAAKAEEPKKQTLASLDKNKSEKPTVAASAKTSEPKQEVIVPPAVKTEEQKSALTKEISGDSLPPARTVVSNTATGEINFSEAKEKEASAVAKTETAPAAATQIAPTTAAPQVETLPKAQDVVAKRAPQDPACANAEQEASRARRSSSDADRLFYLRRAARLCPKFSGYQIEIGQIYSQIGRKEDARFAFNKAIEIDPENAEAKEQLSVIGQ